MKKTSAFSLIELSIVILIIGILIAGVTQSSRLIREFRIKTAQNLTRNSPVHSIKDVYMWLETSLESSFITTETVDATGISAWYDNNIQSIYKNNATQATAGNQPKFYDNSFNNALPGIRFDGTDDYMPFDGNSLIASNYTIFIIERRRVAGGDLPFIGGSTGSANSNLHLLYRSNTFIVQGHYSNDLALGIPAFTVPTTKMHTFRFSSDSGQGKSYWENGGTTADGSNSQLGSITSYPGSALGRYVGNFYDGDLAEIIIFTRALKTEERQSIETYLAKKYSLKIS